MGGLSARGHRGGGWRWWLNEELDAQHVIARIRVVACVNVPGEYVGARRGRPVIVRGHNCLRANWPIISDGASAAAETVNLTFHVHFLREGRVRG